MPIDGWRDDKRLRARPVDCPHAWHLIHLADVLKTSYFIAAGQIHLSSVRRRFDINRFDLQFTQKPVNVISKRIFAGNRFSNGRKW